MGCGTTIAQPRVEPVALHCRDKHAQRNRTGELPFVQAAPIAHAVRLEVHSESAATLPRRRDRRGTATGRTTDCGFSHRRRPLLPTAALALTRFRFASRTG